MFFPEPLCQGRWFFVGQGESAGTMSGRMFSGEDVEGKRRGYKPAVLMTG